MVDPRADDARRDNGRIVFYSWDVATDEIRWSGDPHALLGLPADETVSTARELREHLPESDRTRVEKAVDQRLREGLGTYDLVYAFEHRDGSRRWIRDAGRVEETPAGQRCLGAMVDVTETHDLAVALADSEGRLREVIEAAPLIVYTAAVDDPARTIDVHGGLGLVPSKPSPDEDPYFWQRLLHPDDRDRVIGTLERAAAEGGEFGMEYRYVLGDGRVLWVEDRGRVALEPDGQPVLRGVVTEITRRRLAELERERIEQRSRLLAEISRDLAEAERDLDQLTETIVRRVGTALRASCAVHLLDDAGQSFDRTATHHPDPDVRDRLRRLLGRLPHPADEGLSGHVLRSAELVHVRGDDPLGLSEQVHASWREAMLALGVTDVILAPMRAPGAPVGIIAVGRHDAEPALGEDDEAFLQELADRTGLAVSNARLWADAVTAEEHARRTADVAAGVLRRHHAALQTARFAVWEWDIAADRVSWSGPVREIAGLPDGTVEHGSDRFLDLVHPEDRPGKDRAVEDALAGGSAYDREFRILHAETAEVVWVRSVAEIHRDASGQATSMVGVLSDITTRKHAENELATRAAQQAGIASLSQLALTAPALDDVLVAALDLAAETLAFPHAAVVEHDPAIGEFRLRAGVGWPDDLATGSPALGPPPADVLAAIEADAPIVIEDADAELFEVATRVLGTHGLRSALAVPIASRTGIYGLIGVLDRAPRRFTDVDVSFLRAVANVIGGAVARREAEEQLAQSQKMEAVGRLAGGVAHDFNNLLTVLLGLGEMITPAVAHDEEADADLREMMAATRRAADLVDQLLTFSRGTPPDAGACDAAETLSSLRPMLERLLDHEVGLSVAVDDEVLAVALDHVRLGQILVNLVINARDAIVGRGRVEVRLSTDERGGEDGADVVLRVIDDGMGMDARTAARCVEPFFTTKGTGRGTGLGLSTVYGIVHQAGGRLDVSSVPGAGTTVSVVLPAADPRSVTGDADGNRVEAVGAGPALRDAPRSGRILVVEDQAVLRRLVRETLSRHGYEVLEAANGPDALDRAGAVDGPLDLLLTDVVMPRMSGRELAATLRRLRPELRVLYMSGHLDLADGGRDLDGELLGKPFHGDELIRAVDAAMAARA